MGLISRSVSEKEEDNSNARCFTCSKPVNSLYDKLDPAVTVTESQYQEAQALGMGMYCPSCGYFICIECLPVIKKQAGVSGVRRPTSAFSMPQREKALEELNSEILSDTQRDKIRATQKTPGIDVLVMQCLACRAFWGHFATPERNRFVALVNKSVQDYDAITVGEVTAVISEFASFISRSKQKNILDERLKQLTDAMETLLKSTFPILKKAICAHVDKKEYDEARSLYDKVTEWAEHAKDKGAWENDLNLIDTLINVSKAPNESPSKDDKIITLPPGVERKTILVKNQSDNTKSGEMRWTCELCHQQISINDIGSIIRGSEHIIVQCGIPEGYVTEADQAYCNKCTKSYLVTTNVANAANDKRCLTVDDLAYIEEIMTSSNLPEAVVNARNRSKNLPSNSVRYDSITFDNEGHIVVELVCPKCNDRTRAIVSQAYVDVKQEFTEQLKQQLEFYMLMHKTVKMPCPSCNHNFTICK